MIRKIIRIEKDMCSECISACHEGVIGLVNGKAELLYDNFCDKFGNCFQACPTKAIIFDEIEAADSDSAATKANRENIYNPMTCSCPDIYSRPIESKKRIKEALDQEVSIDSYLRQWPIKIKLLPHNFPYLNDADLLVAADCTAYAFGNFHREYMSGRITIIGCTKLDNFDYSEKLTSILKTNDIKSITSVRMKVHCCEGIENAVKHAIKNCGKIIPLQTVLMSIDGKIVEECE